MKRIIWIILGVVCTFALYLVVMTIGDANAMGWIKPQFDMTVDKDSFCISTPNQIEIQQGNSCSGYASAYVLRHLGRNISGESLYNIIPEKGDLGYVSSKEIVKILDRNGLKAKYMCGNLNALKNEIAKGNPVIVMIRIDTQHNWLHYVPVVGYTPDSIYIAESLDYLANRKNETLYNRSLSSADFQTLWNTSNWKMPLYRNTYITIN